MVKKHTFSNTFDNIYQTKTLRKLETRLFQWTKPSANHLQWWEAPLFSIWGVLVPTTSRLQNGTVFGVFRGFWPSCNSIVSKKWLFQSRGTILWPLALFLVASATRVEIESQKCFCTAQHSMEQVWTKTTETVVTDFVPRKDHCR